MDGASTNLVWENQGEEESPLRSFALANLVSCKTAMEPGPDVVSARLSRDGPVCCTAGSISFQVANSLLSRWWQVSP